MDAGSLLAPGISVIEPERGQRQLKAELLLEAFSSMGIDAMTLGKEDLAFGKDFVLTHASRLQLPYVASNLIDSATERPVFAEGLLRTVGGLKIGVLGIVPEDLKVDGWRVLPADAAAKRVAESLRQQGAQVIVALANQPFPQNETLTREVSDLDILVVGSSRRKLDDPVIIGNAMLLEASSRGKFVGFLEVTWTPEVRGWVDASGRKRDQARGDQLQQRLELLKGRLSQGIDERERQRVERQIEYYEKELGKIPASGDQKVASGPTNQYSNSQLALEAGIKDDPATRKIMDAYLERMSAASSGDAIGVGSAASVPYDPGDLVGSQACMSCHPSQYQQWKSTPHARAYATLQKVHRQGDFQCFGCHVTGHFLPSGPQRPDQVGLLQDVGCESCHMPAKQHVANPTANKLPVRVAESVCLSCHTTEQTQGRFVYETYLPKVAHGTPSVPAVHASH